MRSVAWRGRQERYHRHVAELSDAAHRPSGAAPAAERRRLHHWMFGAREDGRPGGRAVGIKEDARRGRRAERADLRRGARVLPQGGAAELRLDEGLPLAAAAAAPLRSALQLRVI